MQYHSEDEFFKITIIYVALEGSRPFLLNF